MVIEEFPLNEKSTLFYYDISQRGRKLLLEEGLIIKNDERVLCNLQNGRRIAITPIVGSVKSQGWFYEICSQLNKEGVAMGAINPDRQSHPAPMVKLDHPSNIAILLGGRKHNGYNCAELIRYNLVEGNNVAGMLSAWDAERKEPLILYTSGFLANKLHLLP